MPNLIRNPSVETGAVTGSGSLGVGAGIPVSEGLWNYLAGYDGGYAGVLETRDAIHGQRVHRLRTQGQLAPSGELTTNGDFESGDTGWTKGPNTFIFSGAGEGGSWGAQILAIFPLPSGPWQEGFIRQDVSTVAGESYSLSFRVKSTVGDPIEISVRVDGVEVLREDIQTFADWTTLEVEFTATDAAATIRIGVEEMGVASSALVDNVSVELSLPPLVDARATQAVNVVAGYEYAVGAYVQLREALTVSVAGALSLYIWPSSRAVEPGDLVATLATGSATVGSWRWLGGTFTPSVGAEHTFGWFSEDAGEWWLDLHEFPDLAGVEPEEAVVAYSRVQISNMALSHLGVAKRISDPDENSVEAGVIGTHWDAAHEGMFEDHEWHFGIRRRALTLHTGTAPDPYDYWYVLPVDCLRPLRIDNGLDAIRNPEYDSGAYPYQLMLDVPDEDGGAVQVLLTNVEDAHLIYTTTKALDLEDVPASFALALSYRLAHEIAAQIRGGAAAKKGELFQFYRMHLDRACANNRNAVVNPSRPESPIITSRRV